MNTKRYLIKIITSMVVISSILFSQDTYSRLSKSEKKQFITNYNDLITAYTTQNFRGFKIHSQLFLDRYKNILLDPKSTELRESYFNVEGLTKTIEKAIEHKRLMEEIAILKKRTPSIDDIEFLDDYLTFLKENNLDSLFNEEKKYYDSSLETIYKINNKDIEIYRILSAAKYVSTKFKEKEGQKLETELKMEFSSLSSNMNIYDIRKFKEENKGIYKDEILALEEKCRLIDRRTLLRRDINLKMIKKYKEKYPYPDNHLNEEIKKKYKAKIYKTKDIEVFTEYVDLFPAYDKIHAYMEVRLAERALAGSIRDGMAYITLFPEGKYAVELNGYVKVLYNDKLDAMKGSDIDGRDLAYE